MFRGHTLVALALACCGWGCFSAPLCWSAEPSAVGAQPLRANVQRLMAALEYLGAPLAAETRRELRRAPQLSAQRLQALLDPHVLAVVSINPELRVKVQRGAARARLQQAGFTPCLLSLIHI